MFTILKELFNEFKGYIYITLGIILFILLILCIKVVPDDEVCFKKTLGKFANESISSGLNFYNIGISSVICLDAKIQKYESKTETYTKDMQTASIIFFVNWSILRDKSIELYKHLGNRYKNRLASESESAIKSVVGQVDSSYLVSSRTEVERKITELLNFRLKELNLKADSVRLENISYSESYEKSIEEKQIAQQKALTEKNKTEMIKQQAEQKLVSAKAEAEAMRIQTQALAQSKSLIEYEKVQVQKIQAEKWNGVLPQAIYTGTPLPILGVK